MFLERPQEEQKSLIFQCVDGSIRSLTTQDCSCDRAPPPFSNGRKGYADFSIATGLNVAWAGLALLDSGRQWPSMKAPDSMRMS